MGINKVKEAMYAKINKDLSKKMLDDISLPSEWDQMSAMSG